MSKKTNRVRKETQKDKDIFMEKNKEVEEEKEMEKVAAATVS